MGFSVSFGIIESDVTHGIFRKQALEFPRVMSPMGFSVSFRISESDVTDGIFRKQASFADHRIRKGAAGRNSYVKYA